MKKVKLVAILMLFVLALTACTTPQPAKPTTTIYGMQFEVEETWAFEENEGGTLIYFNENDEGCLLVSMPFASDADNVDVENVGNMLKAIALFSGADIPEVSVVEISIGGKSAFYSEATLANGDIVHSQVLYCLCDDGTAIYAWMYMAPPNEYEANVEKVKAILNSIVFIEE